MKTAKELAREFVLNEINPSDYVHVANDELSQRIFLSGFRAAIEMLRSEEASYAEFSCIDLGNGRDWAQWLEKRIE